MKKQQEYFIQNLTLLLRSGMPIMDALTSLESEMHGKKMLRMMDTIRNEILNGASISKALETSGILSKRYITLLAIGEETGQLTEQLMLINQQMNKEKSLTAHVTQALMYPAAVLGVTGIVGFLTMVYTFPKLVGVFTSFGGTLPLSTRIIISLGKFFAGFGLILVPLIFILIGVIVYFLFFFPRTKKIGEALILSIPVINSLVQEVELTRFGYMLGTLIKAGVSIPQALDSLEDGATFVYYQQYYAGVRTDIVAGNTLYESVTRQPHSRRYMPPHVASLLSAGERSGSLPETLLLVSASYEQSLGEITGNLSALLEPVIIVVVGLIVAVVAFSIITPIYDLVNTIN